MNLDTLRIFASACEAGSLIKVAEKEGLSPSGLTKRIQVMEKDLGVSLIRRVYRGIAPTPAGQLLLEKTGTLLKHFVEVRDMLDMYQAGDNGIVTIMGSYSMTAGRLTDDISRFLSLPGNSKIRIHLLEGDKQTIANAVRDGRVAIGVLWTATETSGMQLFPYHQDQVAVVVNHQHPLAKLTQMSYSRFLHHDSVRTKTTPLVERMLERTGQAHSVPQRNRMEVPNFDTLLRLVKDRPLAGLCPIEVAQRYAKHFQLKVIPLTDKWAKRHHVLACQEATPLHPAAQTLLDHLRTQAITP
jgi:DNA-binding transcriptional LysR family regulator